MARQPTGGKPGRPPLIPKALTREAWDLARRYFQIALADCGAFDVYWIPGANRIAVRANPRPARRGSPALPVAAVLVGHYARPYSPSKFCGELDKFLSERGEQCRT